MKQLLSYCQISRRVDMDSRRVKARLKELQIEPVGFSSRGWPLYESTAIEKLLADEKAKSDKRTTKNL